MTESDYESIIKHQERTIKALTTKLLDEFAMASITGLLAQSHNGMSSGDYAADAYELADAMMRERAKYASPAIG